MVMVPDKAQGAGGRWPADTDNSVSEGPPLFTIGLLACRALFLVSLSPPNPLNSVHCLVLSTT